MVTFELSVITTLPFPSSTMTVTAGLIAFPAVVVVGCWLKASLAAEPYTPRLKEPDLLTSVAVIVCPPAGADEGVYFTEHVPGLLALIAHVDGVKLPVPLAVQTIVSPRPLWPEIVAVHVVWLFTATDAGLQPTVGVPPSVNTVCAWSPEAFPMAVR